MSKLSFRARALDASKPMPIYLAEELPDLPDYSAINRAVPQMPSGMEKEEECEHHLQRAICTGLIIPTPEVFPVTDLEFYEKCYPPDYKMPKQHIHMQPLWQEQETPEYDMDSDDERWLRQQRHPELTELKFEQMMDKLEKSSGQTVATLGEAKLLLERQDDLVIAVYDYWLNKRLKTQHPLILAVRTESRIGQSTNNPYLAFRRRTEKMQTRKNRKNDESSYEKMLKLRRDLARAASLLDMVARRERAKRDLLRLTALIAERRFNAGDFSGQLIAEISHAQPQYAAVSLGVNAAAAAGYRREPHYAAPHYTPRAAAPAPSGAEQPRQREKRPHKRRPRRPHGAAVGHTLRDSGVCTSSEEEYVLGGAAGAAAGAMASVGGPRPLDAPPTPPDDGPFAFTRKPGCYYELPTATLYGDPVDPEDATKDSLYQHDLDNKHRYTLTSLSEPYSRCVGFTRRRVGRGGRVLLDRVPTPLDDLWPRLPFTFNKSTRYRACKDEEMDLETNAHRHPKELVRDYHTAGKYPWRHAFRRHLAKKSHLWLQDEEATEDVKKIKTETMDVDDGDVQNEPKRECETANGLSDISVSDDRTMLDERATTALRDHMRKRSWSACSDSSYDSDSSLLPVEENFRQFFEEVNSKWLHFRPKTPPAESPRPSSPNFGDELVAVGADTPLAAELYAWGQDEPLGTAELTLRELHELQASDVDVGGGALDAAPDDLLAENFTGLTDAQLESILAETVADDARRGDDILEELVREVALDPREHFLSRGQSAASGRAASGHAPSTPAAPATQQPSPPARRRASFGSSVVGVSALTADELPLLLPTPHPPDTPPPPEPTTPSASAAPAAPALATPTQCPSAASTAASPVPIATSSPKSTTSLAPATPFLSKISPAPAVATAPSPVPAAKIIVEEVNEVPHARAEARRPRHVRDEPAVAEEAQLSHGVHLKTVHNKHSPLKKHIITSAPHRNANAVAQPAIVVSSASASAAASGGPETGHGQPAPQIVTVAVSENLKVRLQNHLLSAQQATVGLVQNGPLTVSAAHGVSVSGAAVMSNTVAAVSTGSLPTSSTRRVSGGAPVVHLAASALQQKPLQLAPPVVVGAQHTLQHVPPNKLKVVHANALTHTQRAQLLAQSRAAAGGLTHLPAVVSLATLAEGKPGPAPATATAPALQLKAAPGSVAQFFEIKGGPLAKGHQLVNVVRQPHPAKATVARFDLNDPKKRGTHLLATFDGTLKSNLTATSAVAGAPRPHRLSLASLDGRHLVRTAIPGVRAPHLRHQIQFKNRTLQVARAEQASAGGAQVTSAAHSGVSGAGNASVGTVVSGQAGSITIAAAGKSSALPSTVVANLLQKNVAHLQKGQKIAISGAVGAVGMQPLGANMQAIAFTAQQLKARQARLITQPRAPPQSDIIEASTSPAGSSSSNASLPADGGLEAVGVPEPADAAATNGAVRRRQQDTMPMEVT